MRRAFMGGRSQRKLYDSLIKPVNSKSEAIITVTCKKKIYVAKRLKTF